MIHSGFDAFLERLINKTYQHHRERFAKLYGIHQQASYYVSFGGWEISYKGRGRTVITKEEIANNIIFFSKVIYLNISYAQRLSGLPALSIFDFPYLFSTLAHEIAHCVLGDFNPEWAKKHDDEDHINLTREIEDYLWTLPEVQELEKLQNLIDLEPRIKKNNKE